MATKIPLLMKSRGSYPHSALARLPLLFSRRSDRFQSGPVMACAVRPLSRRAWLRRGKGSENQYLICKMYYNQIFFICQSFLFSVKRKGRAGWLAPCTACQKSSPNFLGTLQNAITFMPHSGIKVLALLAATLAKQGIAGHSISRYEIPLVALPLRGLHAWASVGQQSCRRLPQRRAAAPSRSPAHTVNYAPVYRFFDRLRKGRAGWLAPCIFNSSSSA